jgi:hypothetical protein
MPFDNAALFLKGQLLLIKESTLISKHDGLYYILECF